MIIIDIILVLVKIDVNKEIKIFCTLKVKHKDESATSFSKFEESLKRKYYT